MGTGGRYGRCYGCFRENHIVSDVPDAFCPHLAESWPQDSPFLEQREGESFHGVTQPGGGEPPMRAQGLGLEACRDVCFLDTASEAFIGEGICQCL